jgi:hypothetical protein
MKQGASERAKDIFAAAALNLGFRLYDFTRKIIK